MERGCDGFVVIHLRWWTAHVVASGVVGLGKYGKCIKVDLEPFLCASRSVYIKT